MVKNSVTTKRAPTDSAAAPKTENLPATKNTQMVFNSAAIGMSWQLAVVVLVPIYGGYRLDMRLHTSPLWTLVGLALAMIGMILVVRRALTEFNEITKVDPKEPKK
jgi:F0F1-type ATP synthase assembly protein I